MSSLLALVLALFPALHAAQTLPADGETCAQMPLEAEPEHVGMSAERLHRYTEWIDDKVSSGFYPYARTIIAKSGQIIYDHAVERQDNASLGYLQREDATYRFYSMSKIITTIGVAILEEQGKLSYDDRVSKYLPEWDVATMNVSIDEYNPNHLGTASLKPATQAITIRHLLTHTAGLGYACLLCGFGLNHETPVDKFYSDAGFSIKEQNVDGYIAAIDPEAPTSLMGLSKSLSDLPLKSEPGTHFEYAMGHIVAGAIIEKITGQMYVDFISEHIFLPLGMDGMTAFANDKTAPIYMGIETATDEELSGFTHTFPTPAFYVGGGGGGTDWAFDGLMANGIALPDAGWLGTPHDMMMFMLTLGHGKGRAPNGYQLLSPATVNMVMHQNHLPGGKFIEHGYTVHSTLRSEGFLGHALGGVLYMDGYDTAHGNIAAVKDVYQWCGAASTDFTIDPHNDLQILFVSQLFGGLFRTDGYGHCSSPAIGKKLIYASIVE